MNNTRVGKVGLQCEYVKQSLFLYTYLLINVLFMCITTVNLLVPRSTV